LQQTSFESDDRYERHYPTKGGKPWPNLMRAKIINNSRKHDNNLQLKLQNLRHAFQMSPGFGDSHREAQAKINVLATACLDKILSAAHRDTNKRTRSEKIIIEVTANASR
jgi:hypothetical protein